LRRWIGAWPVCMHILFAGNESLYIVFINMLTHNIRFHILRFKKSNVLFLLAAAAPACIIDVWP
jgi:hypothetical protein